MYQNRFAKFTYHATKKKGLKIELDFFFTGSVTFTASLSLKIFC